MVKFGTGGWRAIIGEEFTKENIQKLALAICLKMKAEGVPFKRGHHMVLRNIWKPGNPGVVCKPQLAHSAGNVLCDEA